MPVRITTGAEPVDEPVETRRAAACRTGRTLFFRGTKMSKVAPQPGTECLNDQGSRGWESMDFDVKKYKMKTTQ